MQKTVELFGGVKIPTIFPTQKFAYIKNYLYLCTRFGKYFAPVLNRFALKIGEKQE